MRYWGFFAAKLLAATALIWFVERAIRFWFGQPAVYLDVAGEPFAHDLTYTTAMMLLCLFSAGLVYLAFWDQRYRCRTCLRRLRMPVSTGSWTNMFLKGRPRIEYICAYGHGTLRVPEEQITGSATPDWEPHGDDIWKELDALEGSRK